METVCDPDKPGMVWDAPTYDEPTKEHYVSTEVIGDTGVNSTAVAIVDAYLEDDANIWFDGMYIQMDLA